MLALPVSAGIYILTGNALVGASSLLIVFCGSYGLILFTLEKFIYRKIKLIYKLIHQTKATRKEEAGPAAWMRWRRAQRRRPLGTGRRS